MKGRLSLDKCGFRQTSGIYRQAARTGAEEPQTLRPTSTVGRTISLLLILHCTICTSFGQTGQPVSNQRRPLVQILQPNGYQNDRPKNSAAEATSSPVQQRRLPPVNQRDPYSYLRVGRREHLVASQVQPGGQPPQRRGDPNAVPNQPGILIVPQQGVNQPGGNRNGAQRVGDDARLPLLPNLPETIRTPLPSEQVKRQYERFIPDTINPKNTIDLILGRPTILQLARAPLRIYVPTEEVITVDIIDPTNPTQIAINGVEVGTTVLYLWFADDTAPNGERVLSYLVRVVQDPDRLRQLNLIYEALEREINEAFPDSHVELSPVGDRLAVRGQAKDAIEASQILNVLIANRGDGLGNVPRGEENFFLINQDPLQLAENSAIRRSLIDPEVLAGAGIINMLRIPGEQQVMLRVTVAEINRSAIRSIGADLQIGSGNVSFLSLVTNSFDPVTGLPAFTPGAIAGLSNLLVNTPDFRLGLNALRDLGLARTLAEPNLVTLNGRPAQFFAGDRVPVPSAVAGFGAVGQGVAFEQVGVTLQFVPFIVDRNRVRLQISGQVSVLDDAETNIGGASVSQQNARSFSTTVDLRDGQTMAMAGLIQTSLRSDDRRTPFAGDLPVLGTLFSSKSNAHTEQELVVLVTPELVHPLEACQTTPLPGSDLFEPTDIEFYLKGRLTSRRSRDYRSSARTEWHQQRVPDHCLDDVYIIGSQGYTYGCKHTSFAPDAFCQPPGSGHEQLPQTTTSTDEVGSPTRIAPTSPRQDN